MNYKLIIFDLDGVIINSAPDISLGVNATLKHFGYKTLTIPLITSFIGNGVRTLLKRSINTSIGRDFEYGINCYSDKWHTEPSDNTNSTKPISQIANSTSNASTEIFETALPPSIDFQEIVDWYRNYYTTHAVVQTKLYPGVLHSLKALKSAGCFIAIASNKPHSIASVILEQLDIMQFIDSIAGPEDVQNIKPAPDELEFVLKNINTLHNLQILPKECIMIGDSASDIQAGKNFGAITIAVTSGYGNKEKLKAQNAHFTVNVLSDIINIC